MGQITLQGVRKSFGPVNIIKDANLDIEDGSFVVFVGPSGCGKTTLLRLIAGLEDVTGGQILIDGKNVVDVPPAKRGLSMVFQSYALYPHMSVRGNIAFGLKMAGLPRPEIDRKVEAAAATLNLTPYLDRKPRELSGGQRQRVAIGRAIVREPKAFLFDEPLSNLDAALRVQMRLEVTKLQKQLATTAIYVTHDQVEAMTMADKIVVLNAGRIEQYGSPLELYERPANLFVAGFIGSPKMNFVPGEAAGEPGVATLGVRPEHLRTGKEGDGWPGTVSVAEHLGSDTFLYVDAGKLGMLTARCIGEFNLKAGDRVWLSPDPARAAPFRQGWRGHQEVSGIAPRRRDRQTGITRRCIWKNSSWTEKPPLVTGARPGYWPCLRGSAGGGGSEGRDRRSRPRACRDRLRQPESEGPGRRDRHHGRHGLAPRLRGRRSIGVPLRRHRYPGQ